jgi:hypothetical protein
VPVDAIDDWLEANRRFLVAAIAALRAQIEGGAGEAAPAEGAQRLERAREDLSGAPALDALCASFELSPFERDVIVLCAGVELDSGLRDACAAHQDGNPRPSFSLALSVLAEPHWSALAPNAPLRRWRLVEPDARGSLTSAPLRIDERVLHFLTGVAHRDDRLAGLLRPIPAPAQAIDSQAALARRCAELWSTRPNAVVLLDGAAERVRRVVALAAARIGVEPHALRAADLPSAPAERETLARILEREIALSGILLLVEGGDADGPQARSALEGLLEELCSPVAIATSEPIQPSGRPALRVDVPRPAWAEVVEAWRAELGPLAGSVERDLPRIAAHFDVEPGSIAAIAAASAGDGNGAGVELWDACRMATRRGLGGLAQRIEAQAGWNELVLPERQLETLRAMALHVAHRPRVFEEWGFSARGARGLGATALFCGPSGTGKSLAAEVLACELRLDLYRIDLSAVVSKYIGETEKNLRRLFDAAELSGAMLLFDEADALFGKRSEVRDSHDRYANVEVSYLLQRMEAYNGLGVLTTNDRNALDPAFLRRLRFVVEFPFPDQRARAEIWRGIFPERTPTRGLDHRRLGRLNVTGGNIRNIALSAAFIAAERGEPVGMGDLARAARSECEKLGRPVTEAETGGWE